MKRIFSCSLICALYAMNAQAIKLEWNGFLSVVGGQASNQGQFNIFSGGDAFFVADAPTGGIYYNYLSFRPDTILGLQTIVPINDKISVTAQITASGGNDFSADVRWAYLSYDLNEKITFRAGRLRQPNFLYSDVTDVGYAYHWIRPPTSVYLSTYDAYEGISALYKTYRGDWDIELEALAGQLEVTNYLLGVKQQILKMTTFVGKVNNDSWTVRAIWGRGNGAVDTGVGINGNSQSKGSGGVPTFYTGMAVRKDFANTFIGAEFAYASINEPLPYTYVYANTTFPNGYLGVTSYYITTGYKYKNLIPHFTYEYSDNRYKNSGLSNMKRSSMYRSYTTGIRWDFHPNAAFKTEFTIRDDISDPEYTQWIGNINKMNLFSMGIDIVF